MRIEDLTDITRSCLQLGGWESGRSVDPADFVDAHRKAGLHVHEAGISLFRQLGQMTLRFPHALTPDGEDSCCFTPQAWRASDMIVDLEAAIGVPLMVLAEKNNGYEVLCLAQDGRGFSGSEGILRQLGDSPAEMLNTLCRGSRGEHVAFRGTEVPLANPNIELGDDARLALIQSGRDLPYPARPEDVLAALQGQSVAMHVGLWRGKSCVFYQADSSESAWQPEVPIDFKLRAIGQLDAAGAVLAVRDDGSIFASTTAPAQLWHVGRSINDCLNRLMNGMEFRPVDSPS